MKKVSIVYPVYQNGSSLAELFTSTLQAVSSMNDQYSFEFIFVDDGSTDNSLEKLRELKSNNSDHNIKIIKLSRNFGQMAAIIAGWRASTGGAIINLAADLQDPPEQCIPMIKSWENGNEIVISYRQSHAASTLNKLTSILFYRLVLPNAPRGGFDVALLDRKALDIILAMPERNKFYQYDILWLGFNVGFLPYDKMKRTHGRSQFRFLKRFGYSMNALFYSSYIPLRIMTLLGFSFAFSGFLYSIVITFGYFEHLAPFKGWAPLMIIILVIGGLIMMMLGVLGEYIWRIFDEVKRRPIYIVDKEY